MTIERTTVHVADPPTSLGTSVGRIAMLEKCTIGTDDSAPTLTRYVYSNHLQSASLELDENAAIISYEEYHPYGTTAFQAKNASINAVAKRYRYTGKERDEESGLYYHGARYYIPWLCRWTAIDPMESKYAGMSPYNYSFNNPVMWNDLNGASPGDPPDEKKGYFSDFPDDPQQWDTYRKDDTNWLFDRGEWAMDFRDPSQYASDVKRQPSSAGLFGEGHGLNVWQAAAADGRPEEFFAESRARGSSIETAIKIQMVTAVTAPTIVATGFTGLSALQGAGAISTSTAVTGAAYSGGGSATLTLGGGSGAIGAGGISSGVTWTGIAEAAEGAYVLSSAAISAQEAAAAANAVAVEKIKDEKYITLYRGVSEMAEPQTMYAAAKRGYAVPTAFLQEIPGKQPTTNPDSHVFNSKYSVFSSWTLQENVAMKFATNEGKNNGVILTIRAKVSEMIEAEASNEYFPDDFEVLLYGIRKASPRNVTKTMYKK